MAGRRVTGRCCRGEVRVPARLGDQDDLGRSQARGPATSGLDRTEEGSEGRDERGRPEAQLVAGPAIHPRGPAQGQRKEGRGDLLIGERREWGKGGEATNLREEAALTRAGDVGAGPQAMPGRGRRRSLPSRPAAQARRRGDERGWSLSGGLADPPQGAAPPRQHVGLDKTVPRLRSSAATGGHLRPVGVTKEGDGGLEGGPPGGDGSDRGGPKRPPKGSGEAGSSPKVLTDRPRHDAGALGPGTQGPLKDAEDA